VIHAGGWTGVRAALPPTHFEVLGNLTLVRALEFLVPTLLLMLGNQAMYQKFFSAKSEKDARNAVVGWIIGTVILETAIIVIAVAGSAMFQTGEVAQHPREIIAYTARHGLPAFLGALLLAAVFAKVISTASNFSVFSGNQPGQRYLRPLHLARGKQQAGADRFAI
jgi:SSS family solute:Na+ symporter